MGNKSKIHSYSKNNQQENPRAAPQKIAAVPVHIDTYYVQIETVACLGQWEQPLFGHRNDTTWRSVRRGINKDTIGLIQLDALLSS